MPAINLTIREQGTKTTLNDRTSLDQRVRQEAQNAGNKTGVEGKQTKNPHYIKILIYLFFPTEVCYRNGGSKHCPSPETKIPVGLWIKQKG